MDTMIYLTDDQKNLIEAKQEVANKMLADVKADRDSKQPHQDPAFNLDTIISNLKLLKSETDAIFNLPPPKPKEEEKPKEEDAKMEDASQEKKPEDKEDSDDKAPEKKDEEMPPMEEKAKE